VARCLTLRCERALREQHRSALRMQKIGAYPAVGLKAARDKAAEARKLSDKIDGAKSELNELRPRAQTEKSAAA
jgi:hypothetical protein